MHYPKSTKRMFQMALCLCLLAVTPTLRASETAWPLDKNWHLQSAFLAREDGAALSSESFTPKNWYHIQVPTTVLTALVRANVYPDPYVGMNNMEIPDAWAPFNKTHNLNRFSHLPDQRNPWQDPYWFWTRFDSRMSSRHSANSYLRKRLC